eukprot:SAG31_NODE_22687_length_520_cov_0.821853_1_plen_31_part_01
MYIKKLNLVSLIRLQRAPEGFLIGRPKLGFR